MADVLLRCERIHKSYVLGRTTLPVLRGVDLALHRGKFVAVTGASGSGKSTLLHVLSGLDVPQRGQVYYAGKPTFEPESVRKIPAGRAQNFSEAEKGSPPPSSAAAESATVAPQDYERRRNRCLNSEFGFVFQFYHLLPEFDVLENVMLPQMVGLSIGGWLADRKRSADRAHDLLDRVGLRDRLHHRPNELSGGERQRVAIARALINSPAVLFADEPTGNLDGRTGKDILRLLKELHEAGQTIMMVTHDRDMAREADEVVRLVDGRVR